MKYYNILLSDFKKNYMVYIPLGILLQSCVGSIAAMTVLKTASTHGFPFFQLTLCVIVTMAYNAFILAQVGYKLTFFMLILSMLINMLLIAINL